MEKFTQIEDKPVIPEDESLYQGKYVDIIKYKDTEISKTNDSVAILPYFRDEATFLMRLEYMPAYQYKNRDKSKYTRQRNSKRKKFRVHRLVAEYFLENDNRIMY